MYRNLLLTGLIADCSVLQWASGHRSISNYVHKFSLLPVALRRWHCSLSFPPHIQFYQFILLARHFLSLLQCNAMITHNVTPRASFTLSEHKIIDYACEHILPSTRETNDDDDDDTAAWHESPGVSWTSNQLNSSVRSQRAASWRYGSVRSVWLQLNNMFFSPVLSTE